jgi:primosomal protein N' (replication factor Y)
MQRPERLTAARERVLEQAGDGLAWSKSGLAHAAGVTPSVIDGLFAQGVFEPVKLPPPPVVPDPDPDYEPAELEDDQAEAADALRATVAGGFGVTLLDGVTGSGKTEVYFEAIAEAVRAGRQVLILLPEIALTAQFLDRFHERFGARPAEWHSELAPRMREKVWRQVTEGRVSVVAGARSALFLPFADLGLIIVDEEHDPAYKQEDRVFYNARDMAVVRARLAGFRSCWRLQHRRSKAGSTRAGALQPCGAAGALCGCRAAGYRSSSISGAMPPARGGFLSPLLLKAMAETLERKEQSLLFLNRRGYAPLTLCRVCGHRFECPDCSSWLVEHRFRGQLQCHHCGHNEPVPQACPSCGALDHLVPCGPGIERIAEEADKHFPMRASSCCRRTWQAVRGGFGSSSRRSPRARRISSSARSWWPRGTISR